MAEWKLKTGLDYAAAEVITLGGVQRFVPVLAMRQNRVVVPLMMQVLPVIEAASVRENAAGERIMPSAEIGLRMFNGETIEAMSTMVFVALTRAYEISADDFLDDIERIMGHLDGFERRYRHAHSPRANILWCKRGQSPTGRCQKPRSHATAFRARS